MEGPAKLVLLLVYRALHCRWSELGTNLCPSQIQTTNLRFLFNLCSSCNTPVRLWWPGSRLTWTIDLLSCGILVELRRSNHLLLLLFYHALESCSIDCESGHCLHFLLLSQLLLRLVVQNRLLLLFSCSCGHDAGDFVGFDFRSLDANFISIQYCFFAELAGVLAAEYVLQASLMDVMCAISEL